MKNLVLFFLLCLLITTGACKKNTTSTPPATNNNNNNSTSSTYYGTLEASRTVSNLFPPGNDTSYGCNAYFYTAPQAVQYDYMPGNLISAGNVFIDSVKTQFQSNYYSDSTGILKLNNLVSWNVGGSSPIPQFTYSFTPVWPQFSNYNLLPDTIRLGQNCVLQLSGMNHVSKVMVGLFNPFNGVSQGTGLSYLAANTNYTFTSSSLAGFASGSSCYLSVTMFNPDSDQIFGGKKFFFYYRYSCVKLVYIK